MYHIYYFILSYLYFYKGFGIFKKHFELCYLNIYIYDNFLKQLKFYEVNEVLHKNQNNRKKENSNLYNVSTRKFVIKNGR